MNASLLSARTATPWYRHPWPWLLMAGPTIVIIAGIVTGWLAFTRGDTLVADDYYRKGLAAKQTLLSSDYAKALGLQAGIRFSGQQTIIELNHRAKDFRLPPTLTLTLSHPTRAGLDQVVVMHREGDRYRGSMHLPQSGLWLLLVEDDAHTWRLLGRTTLPAAEVLLGEDPPDGVR